MAIYVDWPTKVVHIDKASMILTQSNPSEIYQLDMDYLRLTLKDLEDDEQGMAWPDTHQHAPPVTVSGAVLARVVEFINGYTCTFEDGQYRVNVVGANTNIGEVTNVNQVSVSTSNSAGLQDLNSLQAASFSSDGAVALKPSSRYTGTTFPVGTRGNPVNNIADAIAIAEARGIHAISIMETMTLGSGDFSDSYNFIGDNPSSVMLTIDPAADVTNCEFRNLTVQGTLDGNNVLRDSHILDLTYVEGFVHQCALSGTISLVPGSQASIMDCYSNVAGGGDGQYAHVDAGGSGSLALRNYVGGLHVTNITGGGDISMDFGSGRCIFESSCTGGDAYIRGICDVTDESNGTTVYDQTVSLDIMMIHKLLRNKKITDPATGLMTVYDDDGVSILYQGNIWEDAAASTAYRGTGLERQDQLA